jgi:hypothetical protein
MIVYTVSKRKEILPILRQAFEGRIKAWGNSTAHLGLEFQVRLKKGKITETICTAKIVVKGNLWFITGYSPIENYCAWFTENGQFRLTKTPPKHWKGNK